VNQCSDCTVGITYYVPIARLRHRLTEVAASGSWLHSAWSSVPCPVSHGVLIHAAAMCPYPCCCHAAGLLDVVPPDAWWLTAVCRASLTCGEQSQARFPSTRRTLRLGSIALLICYYHYHQQQQWHHALHLLLQQYLTDQGYRLCPSSAAVVMAVLAA
jgi:hypothetical protein